MWRAVYHPGRFAPQSPASQTELRPNPPHFAAFIGKLRRIDHPGLLLQGLAVRGRAKRLVHFTQQNRITGRHQTCLLQLFENANVIGPAQ